jgi:hypothetical protein
MHKEKNIKIENIEEYAAHYAKLTLTKKLVHDQLVHHITHPILNINI